MALSTNRTLITQTGINTHQVLNVGGLDSAGLATFSNFKSGSSNLHSTGLTVGDTFLHSTGVNLGTGATVSNNGNATFSGIITATSFVGDITGGGTFTGDISQATGAAAGLGTALSQTQTDPLNKVYYTNKVLSISTTTTIDHPATANLAYTQYGDIKIEDGHDLIIKTDDDFKYDILGISTTKIPSNQFPSGLIGDLTGNVNNSTLLLQTGGTERLRISSDGRVSIGINPTVASDTLFHVEKSGETNVQFEGDTSTLGARLILKNNNIAAGALNQIDFADAGGQSTSTIKGFNTDQTNNYGELSFSTRNAQGSPPAERMRITKEGYVTKPYHPAFSAYINGFTSESTNTGTQIMPFNATYTNVGGHFKTSGTNQYKFVAPVAGNYFISVSQNHSSRVDTRILKNGVVFHGGESENTEDVWDHNHLSCVMPLAVNDIVHVTTNNQDGGSRRAWNSGYWDNFSGFLIG